MQTETEDINARIRAALGSLQLDPVTSDCPDLYRAVTAALHPELQLDDHVQRQDQHADQQHQNPGAGGGLKPPWIDAG